MFPWEKLRCSGAEAKCEGAIRHPPPGEFPGMCCIQVVEDLPISRGLAWACPCLRYTGVGFACLSGASEGVVRGSAVR